MSATEDGKFIARYWLASMPDMRIKAFAKLKGQDDFVGATDHKSIKSKKNTNLFILCSGVDFRFDGNKGKHEDIDGDQASDASDGSGEELQIGNEQHNYKSPAPRPIGSLLSRDISIDLMRYRGSAPLSPGRMLTGQTRLRNSQRLPAMIVRPTIPTEDNVETFSHLSPLRVQDASVSALSPRPLDPERVALNPDVRIKSAAMRSWHESHAQAMQEKLHIMDQYLACCAFLKRSPFLKIHLRRFLVRPSSNRFDLAGCGTTSKDITACFSALSGRGCDMRPDRVSNVQEVRRLLGDAPLAAMDLSCNTLGHEGMEAVSASLLLADFFQLPAPHDTVGLTDLDLSRNALGIKGAAWVEVMVSAPRCCLLRLRLDSNMLTDAGCATVISALTANTSLRAAHLAENGAAAATAIALGALLVANSTLQEAHLAYNHLRGAGARQLAAGLARNRVLRKLDLAWNGFGDEDTVSALARALPTCGVEELNLAYNRVRLKGASMLAASVELGTHLRELVLDGNLIGQIGARVLHRSAQEAAAAAGDDSFPMTISTANCGTHMVDRQAFDPAETAGGYELDLSDGYNRSILSKLMRVAMSGRGSFVPLRPSGRPAATVGGAGGNNGRAAGVEVRISHNGSIDPADWSLTTAAGVTLPVVEPADAYGQPVPLGRVWAKLLGRREEALGPCLLAFSFNNNRRRATVVDMLGTRDIARLRDTFADPLATADLCVEAIDTVFGSDVFVTLSQVDNLFCELMLELDDQRLLKTL